MNVSLTPGLEKFIKDEVASEQYQTSSEVVREGLRLLKRQKDHHTELLRQQIRIGLDELDRGEYIEGKDLSVERIRKLAIKKYGDPAKRQRRKG